MPSSGKIWFITGASSGFGRALAQEVLARGEKAAVAARRTEALSELVAAHPETAVAVPLDVIDATARETAVRSIVARFGGIDVLANIAGRGSLGAAEEFSADELRQQMEVNFFAAAELTRLVLPVMREQGSGHVLQLTSIGGLVAYQGFSAYCASKFALEGWSEALREEVRGMGIRVTIVEPGAFRTEFAGAKNMRPTRPIAAYRPVIEPVEAYLYGSDGKQPGDPHKAALAMIDVVESDDPPLRLLLGADAIGLWEAKQAAIAADLARWRAVGEATAFEGAEVRPVGG
jgi:NAD(P)-dependent dehydrogenase (short-subunit alcohol dehydrogenase family)